MAADLSSAMDALGTDETEEFNRRRREFAEFLEQSPTMQRDIEEMIRGGSKRLTVDIDALRAYKSDLTAALLHSPLDHVPPFEAALREFVDNVNPSYGKEAATTLNSADVHIAFEGSFGRNHVSPRGLTASYMTHMVCVEGIATRCSLVRPKIVKSVHYCPATNKMLSRQYRDSTSLDGGLPTGAVYPTKDDEGHPLETEYGLSQYKDHQTLSVQEMPEHAPIGQLPCSIDVVLDHDLVDKCKPGDRIQIIGIFRGLSGARAGGATSGLFKSALIANHVRILSQDVRGASCTADDVTNIRRVASRDDIFALLSRSIAPSICGSMEIKKAILLQQMGGVERILANGGHIRGDINILMVGDPSTAKSQLLRHCLHLSPLAINTTGRGSSGVGLTAAVTSDPETGERRLEAGAMVLADRGVVCIDEFDKMSEGDRVAIHEVMEQQTVTIAKAGIHCSLNARCSVIAAANPIYGQYDKSLTPQRNVGLPDSLLSRFDLLFIVLDNLEAGHDKKISSHVLRIHQYERPGAEGVPDALGVTRASGAGFGNSMFASSSGDADGPDGDDAEADKTSEVFVRFNPLLHSGAFDASAEDEERGSAFARVQRDSMRELLSTDFVQKYIAYAKRQFAPQLTKAASELLSEAYAELRSKQDTRTSCVTPRVLESLIRLASAHAKTRLSRTVDEEDCAAAVDIMRFALYHDADPLGMHDVGAAGKRVRELGGDAASGGGGGGGNDEGGDGSGAKRQRRAAASSSSSAAAAAGGEMEDEDEMDTDRSSFLDGTQELELDDSQLSQSQSQSQSASADETKEAQIDAPPITVDEDSEAFRNFKSTLAQMYTDNAASDYVLLDAVIQKLAASTVADYSRPLILAMIEQMEENGDVMFDAEEGKVYQV